MYVGVAAGCLALLASLLCRLLPETSNRPLPDTIHDVMEAYRDVFVNMLSVMGGVGDGDAENGKPPPHRRRGSRPAPLAETEEHSAMLGDREEAAKVRRGSTTPV